MKSRKLLLSTLIASSLAFGSIVLAQDTPPPPPPPPQPMPTAPVDQNTPPPPMPAQPADQNAPPAQPMPPTPPTPPTPVDQNAPPPPTTPAEPAAPAMPAAPDHTSATSQTPQGQVTVNSSPAPAPQIGPAPSFEQLSGGSKSITEDQAAAYPPLANDFINADTNKNGRISKAEYEHWAKQPQ